MKLNRIGLAIAGLVLAGSAHSVVVTSTLNGVSILGNLYNVTFHQDSDGTTSFNDVFGAGGSPALVFTAANAAAATADLLAAVNAANFDPTPGSADASTVGFQLFFAYDAANYSWQTGWRNTGGNTFSGVFGPFSGSRDGGNSLSLTTFERVGVPEPASLALAGLALLGLAATRRRT